MLLGPYIDDAWCKWEFEITCPTLQKAEKIETQNYPSNLGIKFAY